MIFSEAEMAEYDAIVGDSVKNAKKGKKPSISSVMMSLQFGVVLPSDDNGQMWFNDEATRNLLLLSVQRLMNEHHPAEFSVAEKALMVAILQIGYLKETRKKD